MGKRILRIADALLLDILRAGKELHYRVSKDGLPPDVKIVDFRMEGHWRQQRGNVLLVLESEHWQPAREGERIPEIEPILETLYPREGDYLTFAEKLQCPNQEAPASPPDGQPDGSGAPPPR